MDQNSSSPSLKLDNKDTMVGFDDDLIAIKERLVEESSKLQVVPIVGMGGIGKTTLAKAVYNDPLIAQHFDIRAWIVVSQEYSSREILLELLKSIKNVADDDLSKDNDRRLAQKVYQNLFGRRYLIVVDDIWSTDSWDDLKTIFPDDNSRSRILLTTRLSNVAVYVGSSGPLHEMQFLNEHRSWSLLREKVFAQEPHPTHLEEIGKMIAKQCHGLPLTIVVVAGLLIKDRTSINYWENILGDIKTGPTISRQCSRIVSLSYNRLPLHLKLCFLYMSAFPEDYEIRVYRLVKLWDAEGFLIQNESKSSEEVGEEYLEDLVQRNLIVVRKRRSNGALKTVGIHDLLREICVRKAEQEGFFRHVTPRILRQGIENNHRRFSIYLKKDQKRLNDILGSNTSSLLFFFSDDKRVLNYTRDFRLLKILDALDVSCKVFPILITELVNLKYLAFTSDFLNTVKLPSSISNLRNLQTLIVHRWQPFPGSGLYLPHSIWQMPHLKHVVLSNWCFIEQSLGSGSPVQETHLQTLSEVTDFVLIDEAITLLKNLKKLGLSYLFGFRKNWESYHIDNLVRLEKLEVLKLRVTSNGSPFFLSANFSFPTSLKVLTLTDCQISWARMSLVGSLPKLEVLKLFRHAFIGKEWYPNEGEFLRLKYLRFYAAEFVHWGVESTHFPSLQTLVLDRARWNEIPCGIGEIATLQLIELRYCEPHSSIVDSVKRLLQEQQDMGNDTLQVCVYNDEPAAVPRSLRLRYDWESTRPDNPNMNRHEKID